MAVAAVGLGGCSDMHYTGGNPLDWFGGSTASSAKTAPNQARNTKNLQDGSKEPYPNLASVPSPPDNAMTRADRAKLAKSLIADRRNARYTDQQLRAGQNMSAVSPPVLPSAAAATATPAPVPKMAASQTPVASTPIKQKPMVQAAVMPKVHRPAAPVVAERLPQPPPPKARVAEKEPPKRRMAEVKRGSERPPRESSLKSPTIAEVPHGDRLKAPPAAPPGIRHDQQLAAAMPPEAESQTLAVPTLPASGRVAEIGFSPGPFRARILPQDKPRLAEVAKLALRYHQKVRVVGHGGASSGGTLAQREFQSFNAALDNAKAVALALTKLGVPANRIDVETKANVNAPDRADIFLVP